MSKVIFELPNNDLELPLEAQKITKIYINKVFDVCTLEYEKYAKTAQIEFNTLQEANKELNYIFDNFGIMLFNADGIVNQENLCTIEVSIVYEDIDLEPIDIEVKADTTNDVIEQTLLKLEREKFNYPDDWSLFGIEGKQLYYINLKQKFKQTRDYIDWFSTIYLVDNNLKDDRQLSLFS